MIYNIYMLKKMKELWCSFLNVIAPQRSHFEIARNITESEINDLPRATQVHDHAWVTALFQYKHPTVKAIIWELKYHENILPLHYIAPLLYDHMIELMSDVMMFDGDARFLLIPIPISTERRIMRGYNQSEHIARAIVNQDIAHVMTYAPQWFEKIIDTPPQSHTASKAERMYNLNKCFRADPRVQNTYVILIDDVVTTGSTLSEARKTLLEAGAKNVYAFTIAH
ncbi:MAG: competence protein ComFC [Patescibacteria group bacterium]|nr:competence protein ComFC [Patescibacteria group bacterium]